MLAFIGGAPALAASPVVLDPVQVTATRIAKPVSAVPAAVTVVTGEALQTPTANVNISEKLNLVPGLLARDRQNYAQDLQISIRGFGARSTFGIRGLRLILDGIPATMPDGLGQVSNIDLASVGRIEVLRGPFSALHGNAAGGVIDVSTADGASSPGYGLSFAAGVDQTLRGGLNARGAHGELDFNVDLSRLSTDGFRDHSRARRDWFNARLAWRREGIGSLALVANGLWSPEAQDPLGLTAAQMKDDPRQVVPAAIEFNTRKAVSHAQVGLVGEREFGRHSLRLMTYAGQRAVTQFLAIPVSAQANPKHGGGVVDLDNDFGGMDGRLALAFDMLGRPMTLVLGVSDERQNQHRRGFNNFDGDMLGVRGTLRRDQNDRVRSVGHYLQGTWLATARLEFTLGARYTRVEFKSDDDFITSSNPDDSGSRSFSATTPVFGASLALAPDLHVYAAYGNGFETPTFDELGYRPDGQAGLNLLLDAARTRSSEIGLKGRLGGVALQAAVFRANTDDELAVATNSGGRSTFQNAGRARRQGAELALAFHTGHRWRHRLALTHLDARFQDGFLTCVTTPCAVPNVSVAAGTRIPGVARSVVHWATDWSADSRLTAGVEVRHVGPMRVSNAFDTVSPGYASVDVHASFSPSGIADGRRLFVRMGNLLDSRHAGSVIVNETSRRYFEPAPGRTILFGLEWLL